MMDLYKKFGTCSILYCILCLRPYVLIIFCASYSFNAGSPTDGRKPTIKKGIGLSLSFFVILFSIFFPFYLSHKKCLFHGWRICLALKHMYLNKVSHLSQSAIFATHLILLKTMTVQTLLSSWGKFVKFHWFQLFSLLLFLFFLGGGGGVGFLDEVWNKI